MKRAYEFGIRLENDRVTKKQIDRMKSELSRLSDDTLEILNAALSNEINTDNLDLREWVDFAIAFLEEGNVPPPGKGGNATQWRYRYAVRAMLESWPNEWRKGDTEVDKAGPLVRWLGEGLMLLDGTLRTERTARQKAATALSVKIDEQKAGHDRYIFHDYSAFMAELSGASKLIT